MRIKFSLSLLSAALLTGCAHEGVVVQKEASPLPFYHSLGVDGSYAFMLRDRAGVVRRQIVTPEVFANYALGDYFNDLQPGPTRDGKSADYKEVRTAAKKSTTVDRIASSRKGTKSHQLASKARKTKRNIAKRTTPPGRKAREVRIAQVQRVATPPAVAAPVARLSEAEFVFVNIARCR